MVAPRAMLIWRRPGGNVRPARDDRDGGMSRQRSRAVSAGRVPAVATPAAAPGRNEAARVAVPARTTALFGAGIGLAAFSLYLATTAPSVSWRFPPHGD